MMEINIGLKMNIVDIAGEGLHILVDLTTGSVRIMDRAPLAEVERQAENAVKFNRNLRDLNWKIVECWLTERNFWMKELSRRTGIAIPTLRHMKRGEQRITETYFERLAGAFGVSVEEFLAGPASTPSTISGAAGSGNGAQASEIGKTTETAETTKTDVSQKKTRALTIPWKLVERWQNHTKITQTEIARRAGINRTEISNFKTRKKDITDIYWERLAKAFNVTVKEFLNGPQPGCGVETVMKIMAGDNGENGEYVDPRTVGL